MVKSVIFVGFRGGNSCNLPPGSALALVWVCAFKSSEFLCSFLSLLMMLILI